MQVEIQAVRWYLGIRVLDSSRRLGLACYCRALQSKISNIWRVRKNETYKDDRIDCVAR